MCYGRNFPTLQFCLLCQKWTCKLHTFMKSGFIFFFAVYTCHMCEAYRKIGFTQHGNWCSWQAWSCETIRASSLHQEQISHCHVIRYRQCNCPAPLGSNARMCPGASDNLHSPNQQQQPDRAFRRECSMSWDCKASQRSSKDAPWCPWSEWSQWDARCGNVSRTRVRQCSCASLSSPVICVSKRTDYKNTHYGDGYESHQQFHELPCPHESRRPGWCDWSPWEACNCAGKMRRTRRDCKCPHVPNQYCDERRVPTAVLISPCECDQDVKKFTTSSDFITHYNLTTNSNHRAKVQTVILDTRIDEIFKRNFIICVSVIVTFVLGGMIFLIARGILRAWRRHAAAHSNGHVVSTSDRRWCVRQQREIEHNQVIKRMPLNAAQAMTLSQLNSNGLIPSAVCTLSHKANNHHKTIETSAII